MLAFTPDDDGDRKSERLEARTSAAAKALIEKAARLQGITASQFAVAAATNAAREIIAKHDTTKIEPIDHAAFLRAIDAEPTPALVAIMALDKAR